MADDKKKDEKKDSKSSSDTSTMNLRKTITRGIMVVVVLVILWMVAPYIGKAFSSLGEVKREGKARRLAFEFREMERSQNYYPVTVWHRGEGKPEPLVVTPGMKFEIQNDKAQMNMSFKIWIEVDGDFKRRYLINLDETSGAVPADIGHAHTLQMWLHESHTNTPHIQVWIVKVFDRR